MVSWWWRCWVGEQRSWKRTLGTSFRLQTLSICVTNNFYHCASKSCFVYARRVTWEKKSFRIFWKCQISNRGKVLVWFVLRKAPVKVDTTILRNKAVTLLPIFSLNNKFIFLDNTKRAGRLFVRPFQDTKKIGEQSNIILARICPVTLQTVHICLFSCSMDSNVTHFVISHLSPELKSQQIS